MLAIFAVHTNLNSDSDVIVINAAQKQRIQDAFWSMHEITYEVEEVDITPEPTEDDPDPEQQTEYILHITVSSKTVDELAELYNFTQDQKDILHELLSEEMRPSLLALCGGIAVADGELCWPLPGHTYISCHFGEMDAFGNAGHRGTDIPAPEGTPILAAHSGTVLVSGWNDSYGNQVLLDNGAGLSTRYAHMTQTAVTAGEAVTAGQVIGYVGSTGDSTGFHLHFEVMQNGVRVNPMYNSVINDWKDVEHQIPFDVRQPKTHAYTLRRLREYLESHPYVNVVRFTTFCLSLIHIWRKDLRHLLHYP